VIVRKGHWMKPCVPWLTRTLDVAGATTIVCVLAVAQVSASPSTAAPSASKTSSSSHSSTKLKTSKSKRSSAHPVSRKSKRSKKSRGQQKIDVERTHQIQEALIRQHYMSGEPSGKWDASTEAALRKFQADNGWQNKTVPDSRALIKLGLGPSHDHLLNPESAMTTTPETPATPPVPTSVPAANGPSAPASQPQQ